VADREDVLIALFEVTDAGALTGARVSWYYRLRRVDLRSAAPREKERPATVATLRIDLQGGFDRDTVEIWVDEERRWRGEAVTTKFTLDLAASVPLEVPDGPTDVRVALPEQGIEEVLEALVAGDTYVVVRVENDRLRLEQLAEAPYYR
jgi:hypothetical protein